MGTIDLLVSPCTARRFDSCPLDNRRAIAWRQGVFLCCRVDQHAEGMTSFLTIDLLVGPCRPRRFGSCPLGNRRAIAWRRGVFLFWRVDQHAEGMTSFFNER